MNQTAATFVEQVADSNHRHSGTAEHVQPKSGIKCGILVPISQIKLS